MSETVRVLVVNPGSASLKLRVLGEGDVVLARRDLPGAHGGRDLGSFQEFLRAAPRFDAAGVRVVHGGVRFRESVRVDEAVDDRLEALADLAPLHNPPALLILATCRLMMIVMMRGTDHGAGNRDDEETKTSGRDS